MTQIPGLTNVNEFYTDHYFSEIFPNEVDKCLSAWNQSFRNGHENFSGSFYVGELKKLAAKYRQFQNDFAHKDIDHRQRIELLNQWNSQLFLLLDYFVDPEPEIFEDLEIPALLRERDHGRDYFVVLPAYDAEQSNEDPLSLKVHLAQFPDEHVPDPILLEADSNWETVIEKYIFGQIHPPRWVVLASDSQLVLVDRTKWPNKGVMRFELSEIFSRKDTSALKAMVLMLHSKGIGIDQASLLDQFDASSHQHAYSVSTDLKYAMRESIELLGNEAIWYYQDKSISPKLTLDQELAKTLSLECLRYMYRLLFLFYLEARPRLGYVPMNSTVFRMGYSLESLRQLELVRMTTERSLNGYFLHESIERLFKLVREGYNESKQQQYDMHKDAESFSIRRIDNKLFANESTPLLNKVKFRNRVLQKVIRLLSLSRPGNRTYKKRGRISYSQLGINQLGAVYESLLSYQGFFAAETLYEVCRKGSAHDMLDAAHFVNAREIETYHKEERVYEDKAKTTLRKHKKGKFIYRLAGRDRTSSASYYTPEPLTRCVVKHALEELITEEMAAADILKLTVCEPAMGSAAFINEAVNQLAERYLQRRQHELNEKLERHKYDDELQKVKRYITDRNVYGVDLNPVAIELGDLSMRLNCMHEDGYSPWFGLQIYCGNSLIGARREFFSSQQLIKRNWHQQPPTRLSGFIRPPHQIYHFLLPHCDMLSYASIAKSAKLGEYLDSECVTQIKKIRNSYKNVLTAGETNKLERICSKIDTLWQQYAQELAKTRDKVLDDLEIWKTEQSSNSGTTYTNYIYKEELAERLHGQDYAAVSEYRRLKLIMDYWCALWFWPVNDELNPPLREEFLQDIELILVSASNPGKIRTRSYENLLQKSELGKSNQQLLDQIWKKGFISLQNLLEIAPRLKLANKLAQKHRFFHWELEFSDIFLNQSKGGFDLVVSNPPWIKLDYYEGEVLAEHDPKILVRKMSATQVSLYKHRLFEKKPKSQVDIIDYGISMLGTQAFLNSDQNFPALKKQRSNLYKAFICQSWKLGSRKGLCGLLHPKDVFDTITADAYRKEAYPRLRRHFRFENVLKLFQDIDSRIRFAINTYGSPKQEIKFDFICNLFDATTVDSCYRHSGLGLVPKIKDDQNRYDVTPHRKRIIKVNSKTLERFAAIQSLAKHDLHKIALIEIHSEDLLPIVEKFTMFNRRLRNLQDGAHVFKHWNETVAIQNGTIERKTQFVSCADEFVYSGPHFFMCNPLAKTPRRICTANTHYDVVDLENIPDDYLPRTNHLPACTKAEYLYRTPNAPWVDKDGIATKVSQYYRLIFRNMVNSSNERSLIASIMPPKSASLTTIENLVFRNVFHAVEFAAIANSLVFDFLVKILGVSHVQNKDLNRLPILPSGTHSQIRKALIVRTLALTCLTSHYQELWEAMYVRRNTIEFRFDAYERSFTAY